jgi:uncharacterized protein YjbI with pentapeptide repeats
MSIASSCRILALAVLFGGTVAATPDNEAKLRETGSCVGCDLFGAKLGGIQAANADLTGANLGEADFYAANLQGANLTNATLDGANFKMANLEGATGVIFGTAVTDWRTICPNGSAGPCDQE